MPKGLATKTVALIDAIYEIVSERQPISVRGVAYVLFTQGHIPNMGTNSTQRVSRALKTARERHIVPWHWIVDETREIRGWRNWENMGEFLKEVRNDYRRDCWATQPERLLVITEKGTVGGVIEPVLREYGVSHLVAHGFNSATLVMDIASLSRSDDRPLTVLYVGDYDPSGMYMSEVDLPRRIWEYGGEVYFERVALTAEHLGGLPSFPAKPKDPRYRWYVERYGQTAWELDALDPRTLREELKVAIACHIDADAWEQAEVVNRAEMASLEAFFDENADLFCNGTHNRSDGTS